MFRGITALNLDAKGRLAIPARYRESLLQQCEGQIVITINQDEKCLWMYPLDVWEDIEEKVVKLPSFDKRAQRLKRLLLGHATDCEMDGSGRVLVPPPLREYGELSKRVMLVGQGNKFEIWDEALWHAQTEAALAQEPDESPMPVEMETLAL
ncbi:MAG TPA: division/cell wall cluster transcriptional repressor MraZ [Arenicellales bacterium]|jgi:MraZ protein|nr:division/cell wall cluster transcriptional repressor MraZ [Arenicellales bacterium]